MLPINKKNLPAFSILLFYTLFWGQLEQVLAESETKEHPCMTDRGVFNFSMENDLWGEGTDRHYTHGTRFSYVSKDLSSQCQPEEPGLWEDFRSFVQGTVPDILELDTSRFNLIFGQDIFTPEDITKTSLISDDRPYAGWMYVGFGFMADRKHAGFDAYDAFEMDIGVVGPFSIAEELQKFVHEVIGSPDPEGWDNQLENEPGILLSYERKWRLAKPRLTNENKLDYDFTPHLGIALGNVYTYLAAGATLRLGVNLQVDYGPPKVRPGVQGSDFFDKPARGEFGWYVFAGIEGRIMGRNIFLDGSTFSSSHSVDKKILVGDLQAGLVLTFKRLRLSFANIFRTEEFSGQKEGDEFGVISLSFRY